MITTLKKISVKELLGLKRGDSGAKHIQKLLESGVSKLYRIKGNVTGYGTKTTQYGESFVLTGQFIAQSLVDGKIFKASKAYLPKDFTETIIAEFKNRGNVENGLEFTAEVSACEDSSVATGYSYTVEPVETEISRSFEEKAIKEFSALPAPKQLKLTKK